MYHQFLTGGQARNSPFTGTRGRKHIDWLSLWSFATYNLRLSEVSFLDLTPREFNALIERYREEQDWLNYRAALMSSVMASGLTGKEFKPEDFMPQKAEQPEVQTPDQIAARLRIYNMMMGGKEV